MPEDETPDWSWTDDENMPSDEEIDRQARRYTNGRRSGDVPHGPGQPLPLTPLEAQALALLAEGLERAQIGAALHCNGESAIKQVLRKLDARNAAHAVALAFRAGLIE